MTIELLTPRATLRFIPEQKPAVAAEPRTTAGARAVVARSLAAIAATLRTWSERRRERALIDALGQLDDVTLRDLGIARGELGSIAAEVLGHAAATRARIVGSRG